MSGKVINLRDHREVAALEKRLSRFPSLAARLAKIEAEYKKGVDKVELARLEDLLEDLLDELDGEEEDHDD